MEMWELVARESIRDLVARYNANGDSGRVDQVMDLFADDAVMIIERNRPAGSAGDHQDQAVEYETYEGAAAVRTIFTGATDRFVDMGDVGHLRHSTSTHQIDLVDEHTAKGRCYFTVLTSVGLDHWGRYIDDYALIDDGAGEPRWRFTRRRVQIDGYSPDSFHLRD